jgi:hypothetical protein
MQELRWNFNKKYVVKLHTVKLVKRIEVYKSCVMAGNNVPFFGVFIPVLFDSPDKYASLIRPQRHEDTKIIT